MNDALDGDAAAAALAGTGTDQALDGNAAAGALSEVFAVEMSLARTTCASCDDARPLGELRAYVQAPGLVLRCRSCGDVQVRLVRGEERAWLDLRGVRALQLDLRPPPPGG